jgi:hypothetical protein
MFKSKLINAFPRAINSSVFSIEDDIYVTKSVSGADWF